MKKNLVSSTRFCFDLVINSFMSHHQVYPLYVYSSTMSLLWVLSF